MDHMDQKILCWGMHTLPQPKQQIYVGATDLFISVLVSVLPEWCRLMNWLRQTGLNLCQKLTILT